MVCTCAASADIPELDLLVAATRDNPGTVRGICDGCHIVIVAAEVLEARPSPKMMLFWNACSKISRTEASRGDPVQSRRAANSGNVINSFRCMVLTTFNCSRGVSCLLSGNGLMCSPIIIVTLQTASNVAQERAPRLAFTGVGVFFFVDRRGLHTSLS